MLIFTDTCHDPIHYKSPAIMGTVKKIRYSDPLYAYLAENTKISLNMASSERNLVSFNRFSSTFPVSHY